MSLLPTPTVVDMGKDKTPEEYAEWVRDLAARHGNNGHGRSLSVEVRLLPTPTANRGRNATAGRSPGAVYKPGVTLLDVAYADRWDEYGPAIQRWAEVVGRPPPEPVDDEGRLAAPFVEWMLGWPDGWTVGSRVQRIRQCGNGVVPQQAVHAYRALLHRADSFT